MENIDKKILKIENDICVLMDFRKQMIDDFKNREPAARTWEFINSMKIDMALNAKDHQELKEGLKSIEKKLDDVMRESPTKSSSWAEGVLKIVGYVILVALVGSFLLLIVKDNLIR